MAIWLEGFASTLKLRSYAAMIGLICFFSSVLPEARVAELWNTTPPSNPPSQPQATPRQPDRPARPDREKPFNTVGITRDGRSQWHKNLDTLMVPPPYIPYDPESHPLPDLPPELHDLILSFVLLADSRPDNTTVAACAATCRQWKETCWAVLFRSVVISEADQLEALAAHALQGPQAVAPVCRYSRDVYVEQGPGRRWTHLVPYRLGGTCRGVRKVCFVVRADEATSTASSSGVMSFPAHPSISKLMPAALSRFVGLQVLELEAYAFTSLRDVLRVLAALPTLVHFSCKACTWGRTPPSTARPLCLPRTPAAYLARVDVAECSDAWALVWAWSAAGSTRGPPATLNTRGLTRDEAVVVGLLSQQCLSDVTDTSHRRNARMESRDVSSDTCE